MRKIQYIYFLLVGFIIMCLNSCIRDDFGMGKQTDFNSVTINVLMPKPVVTNPMTRAGAADFDRMDDLNVVIASGPGDQSSIVYVLYFRFADVVDGGQIDGMNVYYYDTETENGILRQFQLTFTKEWLSEKGISSQTCQFYLVANWGNEIFRENISTVEALRSLEAQSKTIDNTGGRIEAPNVMFGEKTSEEYGTHTHPGTNETDDCRKITMELKRTAAMITVVMDGSGLEDGIVISPTRISLHNVPNTCTIGKSNVIATQNDDGITPVAGTVSLVGEIEDGRTFSGGASLVGSGTKDWTGFTDGNRYKTTIGKHYNSTSSGDLSDQTVSSLFLYENTHAEGFGATGVIAENQWLKRPAVATGTTEADIEAASGTCSYIEVEAEYTKYKDNSMTIAEKGTASWRFFLGENAYDNFDVMRNTYYKVTLTLRKTGIGEGNASWRVDSDLEEPVIVGDTEMVVGGGGEMFCVEFVSQDANHLKLEGVNDNFVYVYTTKGGKSDWYNPSAVPGASTIEVTAGKQIWFYVSPFLPNTPGTDIERKCSVEFQTQNGTPVVTIEFTQYRPITVEVTKDDVAAMPEVKNMIETYYNYSFETNTEPFTFYVDRVDRNAMPWGFSGVQLDANHSSGFENVYHLIDPLDGQKGEHCEAHVEYARNYLPTGKGFKDPATDYIDYSNGSCMMHAAMENYFQQYYPKPGASISPDDILNTGLPPRPGSPGDQSDELSYGWCVPSIVGWQLLEKLENHKQIFDPNHPIAKWTSYWTSNAGTYNMRDEYPELNIDGKTNAFVYQFDMGLDKIQKGQLYPGNLLLPRSTPIKYRLINIDSKYRKDVNLEPDPME